MKLKDKIIRHYDVLTPYYKELWGIHIHHGYWKTGSETREQAQEQLIKELIARAGIKSGARILDVGCGIGGTSIYLHKTLHAKVTGITISQNQIDTGNRLAREANANIELRLLDADKFRFDNQFDHKFDVIWSVEALSHFEKKAAFFASASRLLNTGGKLVIADWFRSNLLTKQQEQRFIEPIEKAMLLPKLESPMSYMNFSRRAKLNVTLFEDVSSEVARTWDITATLVKNPALWKFAASHGEDFMAFLKGFGAMKAGFRSRTLRYGIIIAQN